MNVKKVTLRDVARQARVHYATASTVLNGARGSTRVSQETSSRVLQVATDLGYRVDRAAQQLRTRRSRVIGLLTGGLENPFFARMVSLCSAALEREGYDVVLAARRLDEASDLHLLESLLSRQLAGVLLWSETDTQARTWIEHHGMATTVVMGVHIARCDSVAGVLETGLEDALDHLRAQGYQRIGYFAPGQALNRSGDARDCIYSARMAEWGMPERIINFDGSASDIDAARAAAEALAGQMRNQPVEERIDALLCFNDMNAFGAMMGLRRCGLRVPDDIALIGCDGLPLVAHLDVPLTTIDYPLEEICQMAVGMLIERIKAEQESLPDRIPPRTEQLPTRLIIRESSIRRTVAKS